MNACWFRSARRLGRCSISSDHCKRIARYVENGVAEGATLLVDGRERKGVPPGPGGFFLARRFRPSDARNDHQPRVHGAV